MRYCIIVVTVAFVAVTLVLGSSPSPIANAAGVFKGHVGAYGKGPGFAKRIFRDNERKEKKKKRSDRP
jgi:hypothetical protein